jgi:cytochrome c-type biogenesis protein CcmE
MQQALRHFYPYANAFERVAFDEEDYQEEIEAYYEGHLPLDPFRDGPWTVVGSRAPQEEARR